MVQRDPGDVQGAAQVCERVRGIPVVMSLSQVRALLVDR